MAQRRTNAFTLIETVLSLGIFGLIAASLSSIVLLTSRALPAAGDADVANVATRETLSRVVNDIASAVSVKAQSARGIRFDVADRDGDGNTEEFEYLWSGTPGDPLVWKYNGSEPITVASNVTEFVVSLDKVNVSVAGAGADTWGAEEVLYQYQGSSTNLKLVQGLSAYAQYFRPSLPTDATGWSVTRVQFLMSRSPSATLAPVLQVQLADPDLTGSPSAVKEAAMTGDMSAVTGTSGVLVVFTPTAMPIYAPGSAKYLCFSAPPLSTKFNAVNVHADDTAAAAPGQIASTSTGLLWTTNANGSMACVIYGKVRRPGITSTSVQHATCANVKLVQGAGAVTTATARMLNRPEVP